MGLQKILKLANEFYNLVTQLSDVKDMRNLRRYYKLIIDEFKKSKNTEPSSLRDIILDFSNKIMDFHEERKDNPDYHFYNLTKDELLAMLESVSFYADHVTKKDIDKKIKQIRDSKYEDK